MAPVNGANNRQWPDVIHSIVSAEAIAAAVAGRYHLGEIVDCHFVSTTLSDVYRLSSENGTYFSRLSAAHLTTQQDPIVELEALRYLHAHGGRVAVPVLNTIGEPYIQITAPEGERILAVFESAPGRYIELTCSDYHLLGTSLALLHEVASTAPHDYGGRPLDLRFLLDEPLRLLQQYAASAGDLLSSLATSVRSSIEKGCSAEVRNGFCHGDAWANINIDEDGAATFFDFDLCGAGWPIYDVATVGWGLWREGQGRASWQPLWEAFQAGYRGKAHITDHEAELISCFAIVRDIWSMGNLLANADRWGYRRLTSQYFDNRLVGTQALRTALA